MKSEIESRNEPIPDVTNMEKGEIYRQMMKDLKKAQEAGFYYEVIFISYAILEDRSESVLRHAGVKPKYGISQKIKQLRTLPEREPRISRLTNTDLLDEVASWLDERNSFIHSLAKIKHDRTELEEVAGKGATLAKDFSNRAGSINRKLIKLAESAGEGNSK